MIQQTPLDKMKKVAERREFTNFWEAFRYMSDAGFTELEALKIGLELFDGKMWTNVINASWRNDTQAGKAVFTFSSGYTTTITSSGATYIGGIDPATCEPDDLMVEIFIMTKEGNPIYQPIYKSYIETRNYDEIPELENHIKSITIKLTTELAINLFKEGCKTIK